LLDLDLPEDDFFSGERSRSRWECECEWEDESSSLVDPGVFFDFLGDLEKSFCIEKATEKWRRLSFRLDGRV